MLRQKLFISLFILPIVFCSCGNVNNNNSIDTSAVVSKNTTDGMLSERKKDSLLNETNLLKKSENNFLEEIHDLKKRLLLNPSDSLFNRLNILSCKTDGESSEELGVAMVSIFEKHFSATFEYLFRNQGSCLADALMQEYSERLSVSEGEERVKDVTKLKKEKLEKAANLKYSKQQITYLNFLLEKIKPEIFD